MNQEGFIRVKAGNPCPICKKTDWCGVSADGVWAVCMRVEGGLKQCKNGGYLHRLKDSPPVPVRRMAPTLPPRRSLLNMADYHAALRKKWTPALLTEWAEKLNVWEYALDRLQPAWDSAAGALAFPMRDGAGTVVGIRLRAEDGRKWAVGGSKEGLFYDPDLEVKRDLVVCEGPTDAAAAYSLDLDVVGRPSCASGVQVLIDLARRLRVRTVTIIADHDQTKVRPDGGAYHPGLDGAVKLIGELRRVARIVVPPAKDMRAWFGSYRVTRAQFDMLADAAKWRMA